MLRINVGWSDEREAHQIALGLEEANLRRMKDRNDPVVVTSESLQVRDGITNDTFPGFFTFVIFATGRSQRELQRDLQQTLELCCVEPEARVTVLNLEEKFWVAPIPSGDRMWYFVGLHDVSMRGLRARQTLHFRSRLIEGGGLSIEVNIFWGENRKKLLNELRATFGRPKPR